MSLSVACPTAPRRVQPGRTMRLRLLGRLPSPYSYVSMVSLIFPFLAAVLLEHRAWLWLDNSPDTLLQHCAECDERVYTFIEQEKRMPACTNMYTCTLSKKEGLEHSPATPYSVDSLREQELINEISQSVLHFILVLVLKEPVQTPATRYAPAAHSALPRATYFHGSLVSRSNAASARVFSLSCLFCPADTCIFFLPPAPVHKAAKSPGHHKDVHGYDPCTALLDACLAVTITDVHLHVRVSIRHNTMDRYTTRAGSDALPTCVCNTTNK